MNKNRLSLEEPKELKPSSENPIELVCDDGHFSTIYKKVKVVGHYKERLTIIRDDNRLDTIGKKELLHYPSLKKEREKMEFKAYWVDGGLRLLNKDSKSIIGVGGKTELSHSFSLSYFNIIPAKGIESVWRHTDDWSVCDG